MSKPLKLFIKKECLQQNAANTIQQMDNVTEEQAIDFFNENTTHLIPRFVAKRLGRSIFSDMDTNKDLRVSTQEIFDYLKVTYNISEQELASMTVEEAIYKVEKYLAENSPKK